MRFRPPLEHVPALPVSPFVVLLLAALVYVVWTVKRGSAARPRRGLGSEPLAARTRRLRDWDGEQPLDASPAPPATQVWPSEAAAEPLRVAARSASTRTAPRRPGPLTPTPTAGIGSAGFGAMGTGSPATATFPPASVPTVRAMPDSARAVVAVAPEFARVAPRPGPPVPPRPESRPRVEAPRTHPDSRPSPDSPHTRAAKTPAARTPAAMQRGDAATARAAQEPATGQNTAHDSARTPGAAKTSATGASVEVAHHGPGKLPRASSDAVAAAGQARH